MNASANKVCSLLQPPFIPFFIYVVYQWQMADLIELVSSFQASNTPPATGSQRPYDKNTEQGQEQTRPHPPTAPNTVHPQSPTASNAAHPPPPVAPNATHPPPPSAPNAAHPQPPTASNAIQPQPSTAQNTSGGILAKAAASVTSTLESARHAISDKK